MKALTGVYTVYTYIVVIYAKCVFAGVFQTDLLLYDVLLTRKYLILVYNICYITAVDETQYF